MRSPQNLTWGLRTNAEKIDHVTDAILEGYGGRPGQFPLVVTPNVDILISLEDASPYLRSSVDNAAIVLADGQPLVSFSHLAGDRLTAKLAGSDLTQRVVATPSQRGSFRIFGGFHRRRTRRLFLDRSTRAPPRRRIAHRPLRKGGHHQDRSDGVAARISVYRHRLSQGRPRRPVDHRPLARGMGPVPMILAVGASLEFISGQKKETCS